MFFNIMKFNYLILLILLINVINESSAAEEPEKHKCFVCKSSEKPECTKLLSDTDTGFIKDCDTKDKKKECHAKIDESGKTVRDCGKCPGEEGENICKTFGEKENKEVFPKTRPICPQCTDCETVVEGNKKLCEIFKEKSGCYTGTDGKSTILRGCESDPNECDEKTKCNSCKEKECEATITLPKKKCIACSDEKDCKRPAELPNGKCNVDIKVTKECSQDKDGKYCYTYKAPDNTVKRGCAKEKPIEKNMGITEFCSEDNCNSECVHDINCAQCTEKENADCKEFKDEWYKKKCDNYTTVCHTCKNKEGKIERGCGKPIDSLDNCEYLYNDTSIFTCYRCRSDLEGQKFCARDKIEDSQLKPEPCKIKPNNDAERKCYIDSFDGIVIRGCVSDIVQSDVKDRCKIDGKGKDCYVCDKQNCNNGEVPGRESSSNHLKISFGILIISCLILLISYFASCDDLSCITCSDDKWCKRPEKNNTNDCQIKPNGINIKFETCTFDSEDNLCYVHIGSNNIVTRGCANDKPENGRVITCKKGKCNLGCVFDINCQQCIESEDPDCAILPEKPDWLKNKCGAFTSSCYRCEDNDGKTIRGCGKPNPLYHCNYCYDDACKPNKPPRICYTCEGENDPNCQNSKNYNAQNCNEGIDHCVIEINAQGYTNRRCARKNEKCEKESTCKMCDTNKCNGEIFPPNRLNCYKCGSDQSKCTNPDQPESDIKSLPCRIYKENDQCYTYGNIDGNRKKMVRGCNSDSDANFKGCKDMKEKCLTCKTNNCNHFTYKISKLMCMKCDSDTNLNCGLQQNKHDEKNCDPTEYWKDESCFTFLSGSKVIRSCISEFSDILCNSTEVTCCNSNGCNTESKLNFTCYKCRSDIQPECSQNNLTTILPTECINVNGDKRIGCYIETWNQDIYGVDKNVVSRGCLSEKSETTCLNKTTCIECDKINCNNGKPPKASLATKNIINKLTTLCYLVIIFKNVIYVYNRD